MTNVIKFGRKVLTMGTVFSTILWSVGVSALVPAMAQAQTSCPAFQPGDMIKVTGRPAIYSVDANGRVLYFPSGDEFKSWNTGETYGGYTTVSQSCFDSLPVPTSAPLGVNFRPGSYVVKRPSSDQLYVVEPNNTLATITTAAASALYGASYKVRTVADVFWPNYGNVRGTPVTEAKAHPGMLVSNGGKTYFVDSTGALREVTAAGFTANRFKQAFVRPIASTAGYTVGTQLTAFESAASDRTQTGVSGSGTPVTGGAVTVSLASDNPAGTILASGTAFNPVLKLNLTAGSQAVSITGLTLRKTGLAANTVISGVEIVDSAGVRHGNIATSLTSENDVTLLFAGSPINIAAGTTQAVTIRINLATSGSTGTLQFSVVGASSVSGAAASGSFPVTGNTFTLQSGSAAIATSTVDVQAISGASGATLNVDSVNQQEITKFSIREDSSNENILFKGLTLYNNGTAADSDLMDVQLVSQEGNVLATAQQVAKVVAFNLVTPYTIDKGTTKNFTVRAKIVGGANRTIQLTIFNNYDVVLTGQNTGAGILPVATSPETSFPIGDPSANYNKVTVGSGSMSFNKDVTSPTGAMTPAQTAVVLGKWYVKPTGENMELRQLTLAINPSVSIYSGSVTVKVNGSSVYSGSVSGIATVAGSPTTLNLSTYPTLVAGQNSYITVEVSNVVSGAANGATSTAYMDVVQVRRLLTNDILDPGVTQTAGNQLTVQAGALKVTTLATPVATSLVVGSTNVELAKVELNAGTVSSGEEIKVTRIVVSDLLSSSTIANVADFGNLVMYDANGNALATSASTVTNAASTTFSFVTPVIVPKTGAVTLTLKGDVLQRTGAGTHTFSVGPTSDVTAIGSVTGNGPTVTKGTGNGQAMTIVAAGTVLITSVSGAGSAPVAASNVTVGTSNVAVFAFKLTALNEPIKLTSLKVTATGTAISVNDLKNIRLYKDNETSPFASAAQMTADSATVLSYTWTATDNILPAAVQPGTPVTVYVKADVGLPGTAVLGDNFRFLIAAASDVTAVGQSGAGATETGAPAVTALTYVAPFSVSVTADSPIGNLTQNIPVGTQVAKVKVTNNGQSPITLTGMTFANSGSSAQADKYDLLYSDEGSTVASTVGANSVTGTAFTGLTVTINGGASRYFAVAIDTLNSAANSTWQLSVAAHGDVTYTVLESDLGYDTNADAAISGSSAALYAEGKPVLGTMTDN